VQGCRLGNGCGDRSAPSSVCPQAARRAEATREIELANIFLVMKKDLDRRNVWANQTVVPGSPAYVRADDGRHGRRFLAEELPLVFVLFEVAAGAADRFDVGVGPGPAAVHGGVGGAVCA